MHPYVTGVIEKITQAVETQTEKLTQAAEHCT